MSALIPLPPQWSNEECWECKFLFERGDARLGPCCAPLCGHHAEVEEVDGVLLDEWNAYLYPQ